MGANQLILLRGGLLLDTAALCYRENAHVLVEGELIREVDDHPITASGARIIEAGGRVIMPGLIDAHVHVIGVTSDLHFLSQMSPYLVAARAKRVLGSMLMRGFTTVRDAGGAEWGIAEAVRQDDFEGPRLFVSGLALAQSGGQGDFRTRGERTLGCPVCRGQRSITRVVDGVGAVRRAVREELRQGANQIKIMASGGIASDIPAERAQFSVEELHAAVDEAARAGTYVMAHAYGAMAVRRCIDAGVRSIEHGSLIDTATATLMAKKNAFLVPTLSVLSGLCERGKLERHAPEKCDLYRKLLTGSISAIETARTQGVSIGHGSDLEGDLHALQSREFLLKREVMPAAEVVASATIINAEILDRRGALGVIAPGAVADILVLEGDPLNEVGALADPDRSLKLIMKAGRIYRDVL
jgi:imidazolonepropionase-like amidohydrolase